MTRVNARVLDVFALATNEDGKLNIITGELDFIDDEGKLDYHFSIKKALVSEWTLINASAASAPTLERFTLKVGEMVYVPSDDANQKKFEVEAFKKLKVGPNAL